MLKAYDGDVIAECRPVMLNSSSEMGIICIIYRPDELDGTHIAHESVHITDYYFEVTGMNGEEFSGGGNEGYAYLVLFFSNSHRANESSLLCLSIFFHYFNKTSSSPAN